MATEKATLVIHGMHCASCTQRVERALAKVRGVSTVRVDLAAEQAVVEYAAEAVGEAQLKEVVRSLGYKVP